VQGRKKREDRSGGKWRKVEEGGRRKEEGGRRKKREVRFPSKFPFLLSFLCLYLVFVLFFAALRLCTFALNSV
jgi:hypothetical protein